MVCVSHVSGSRRGSQGPGVAVVLSRVVPEVAAAAAVPGVVSDMAAHGSRPQPASQTQVGHGPALAVAMLCPWTSRQGILAVSVSLTDLV